MRITWLVWVGLVAFPVRPGFGCTFNEYLNSEGECCPMCDPGKIVQTDCTTERGTRCKDCGPGTFMDKANGQRNCFTCFICDPAAGLLAKQQCTVTSDAVCDAMDGFFCKTLGDGGRCTWAEKHSICGAGQSVKVPGTIRKDTVCEDCEDGYFSTDGLKCSVWTKCSGAQTMVTKGTSKSDVVCSRASQNLSVSLAFVLLWLAFVFSIR